MMDVMCKHTDLAYLQIAEKRSVFVSQLFREASVFLRKTQKPATTEHIQTMGILNHTHASVKTNLTVDSVRNS